MSNEKPKTPISKATNVAEDFNKDDNLENIIKSEFIIVSTDEKKKTDDQNISKSLTQDEATDASQHRATLATNIPDLHQDELSISTNTKKTSSKVQNNKKGGPSAKMLSIIQDRQKARIEAERKVEEETKEKQRRQEEYERQEQERLRLAQEYRDKKKEKEKNRIQRQKHGGSYLTKEQRQKRQRAQVQLEAAGIQIPARIVSQSTISNNSESSKKRVLYDDHRKTNTTPSNTELQLLMPSIESENKPSVEETDGSTDDWEQDSEEENMHNEKLQIRKPTEDNHTHLITNQKSLEIELTDSDEDENDQPLSSMERVRHRLERHHRICESHRSCEILRAPVICVLGHVDAGKTTILDNLRRTHVQTDEAGGITQQIGATNVPLETILERTKMCRKGDIIVPGLLIIDTPGHETFKNLRSRGSSLCDLAILVVDIMDGLQPQTIESIKLLTQRQTPFIVALNKIDLLYGWKGDKKSNVELVLQQQNSFTHNQFEKRCNDIIVQFAEQGVNVALYYKNTDPNEFFSMVPTSARSGDGMGSLIAMIIEISQTSLAERISFTDELQATVMEVKAINGLGTTIDVALVNGTLSVGDKIVIGGQEGPIVTQIRGLLIPESNQELRVTNQYENNETVKGARGIKILAKDLEKSMAGLPLFVARKQDEIDYFKTEIEQILSRTLNSIKLTENGVYVQASTLGSLEAFLELLKTRHIPYAGINIGPVHRKDVIRASTQLERDTQWATILAFDVKIERDAQEYAKTIGVKIFQNDEIYRLCDMFISHQEQMKEENKAKHRHLAVFPCKLKILPRCIFNSCNPFVCGVRVEDGFIKLGTPICVPSKDYIELGRVASIEMNHKPLDMAKKGSEVSIKIISTSGDAPKTYGRHFDEDDILMSKISRQSIDVLKEYFREDMQATDWQLMVELKQIFNIV